MTDRSRWSAALSEPELPQTIPRLVPTRRNHEVPISPPARTIVPAPPPASPPSLGRRGREHAPRTGGVRPVPRRTRMIGQRFSHYRIEDKLGEGGMGEVFLAHDLALGRPAAIKVLPANFSEELRRRLLREAETSRRLQHPGIATF